MEAATANALGRTTGIGRATIDCVTAPDVSVILWLGIVFKSPVLADFPTAIARYLLWKEHIELA